MFINNYKVKNKSLIKLSLKDLGTNLFFNYVIMPLQVKIHISENLLESKEVIDRLVNGNINTKLDIGIKKFKKEDSEGIIDFKIDKNKKGLFNAKIQANLDGSDFRFEREDYKNLDDLINHLFEHFKEQLIK